MPHKLYCSVTNYSIIYKSDYIYIYLSVPVQDTAVGPIEGELDITYTEYDQGYISKLTISSISLANQVTLN